MMSLKQCGLQQMKPASRSRMLPKILARRALATAPLLAASLAHSASAQQVVTIPTRPGVTISYLLLQPGGPRPPTAAVVLLAGGNGALGLAADGSITTPLVNNFLIRSRQLFANNGLYVAALDTASD